MVRGFTTEQDLTAAFLRSSHSALPHKSREWHLLRAVEVQGLFGRPDVVIAAGKVFSTGRKVIFLHAFEAKLANWRRALAQAFRYAAFAHCSTVILDDAHRGGALKNLELFHRSNVGLLSISSDGAAIWHNAPEYRRPYSAHLFGAYYAAVEARLFSAAGSVAELAEANSGSFTDRPGPSMLSQGALPLGGP